MPEEGMRVEEAAFSTSSVKSYCRGHGCVSIRSHLPVLDKLDGSGVECLGREPYQRARPPAHQEPAYSSSAGGKRITTDYWNKEVESLAVPGMSFQGPLLKKPNFIPAGKRNGSQDHPAPYFKSQSRFAESCGAHIASSKPVAIT